MASEPEKRGFLAVIPARGGSKRLPGKNLRSLGGIPLIAWTVRAARGSALLDETLVTTDSPEIAEAAVAAGAIAPFLRPAELASDTASTFDAVKHALDFCRERLEREFEYTVLLQPTSPLRGTADVDEAIRTLRERSLDAVISVCECEHNPLWSNTLPEDLSLAGFLKKEAAGLRSQDMPAFYRLNGAIYVCRTERLLRERTFFLPDRIGAFVMPRERSVDIDNELDFAFAEFLAGRRAGRT